MRIFLHEITDRGSELSLDEGSGDLAWLETAISRIDEDEADPAPTLISVRQKSAPRPYSGYLSIRKVDDVVVVSGQIRTQIHLNCSRCTERFDLEVSPSFSSLFCQDPAMAGVGYTTEDGKVAGKNRGLARHAHDFRTPRGATGETQDADLDITYLSEEYIDLADVLSEQLRLSVPFQPLCKEDCKGICPTCGTDWNRGRCACAKIQKTSPFSVLSNLKL